MLTRVQAGPYTIQGVSVGGVYTSIAVPELDVVFDAGMALRTLAGPGNILLSHAHADHIGALPALLGIRTLIRKPPASVFLPAEIEPEVAQALAALERLHGHGTGAKLVPLMPGDTVPLRRDLSVRAFRTHHPVTSLGYQCVRPVRKLRPEFHSLEGNEIARRRRAGEDLFEQAEHLELAYATDTLVDVLDSEPSLLNSRVLILECSFLDERKALADARAGGHIHLDEVLARSDCFNNEHLVLMHFSQLWSPEEVRSVLRQRCPPHLFERIVVFAPDHQWPG